SPPCTLDCSQSSAPSTGTAGSAVSFTGSATAMNCAGSPGYEWDFGDNTLHSFEQNPQHSYALSGQYGWSLTVTVSGGSPCNKTGTIDVTANCSYQLSATSATYNAAGGNGQVNVTAPAGCAWTAVNNSTSVITITSGASGS